tara:strand:- start:648 stop:1100 length:453 start_codon:yes stop_codon:yes gene_type:complete
MLPVTTSSVPLCERNTPVFSIALADSPEEELYRLIPVELIRKFDIAPESRRRSLTCFSLQYQHTDVIVKFADSGDAKINLDALIGGLLDEDETYIFQFFPVSLQMTEILDKEFLTLKLKRCIHHFYPDIREWNKYGHIVLHQGCTVADFK